MSIWVRRTLMLSWLLLGVIPMTLLFRLLFQLIYQLTSDVFASQFICFMPCVYGYVGILWMISELPVRKTGRDA